MLFEEPPQFSGLPDETFELFSIQDREQRRKAITGTLHPALGQLGDDLVGRLSKIAKEPLHAHLPRLDWPRGYEPFCTWLALSFRKQGYQQDPQLNVGVHVDFVAIRLGWDTGAEAFGRFEFLSRHGELGRQLIDLATRESLRLAVYASAPWPVGSRRVFDSATDLPGSFDEVRRRGVWWELGRRFDLPEARSLVCSPELGHQSGRLFERMMPAYERILGESSTDS